VIAIAARPSARFFAKGRAVAGAVPVGSAADKLLAPEA
jgi:hypothetical protein